MPVIISRASSGGGGGGVTPVTGSVSGFATRSDLNAQTLSVSPSGGTAPYSYAWSSVRPDGTSSTSEFDVTNAASVSFTPARVGLYSVSCVITDSAGSPQNLTVSATAKVGSAISVSLGGFTSTTDLAAQSLTSTPTNGTGGYSYAWTVTKPDGTSGAALLSSTTDQNPTLTPVSPGLHTVSVTVTDSSSQTATASSSQDIGTGVVSVGTRTQITSLSGWTAVEGPNTQSPWVTGASITVSSGVFTFADGESPTTTLNQPQEMKVYYSTAAELSAVDFTGTPGVLTLRLEAQGSNSLAGAKQYLLFGIIDSPYSGSQTTDWAYGSVLNENGSGKSSGGVCLGNDASSVTYTSASNNNGQEILDCVIYINIDGDPDENLGNFFQGTTMATRVLQSNVQTQFSANNDARLILGIGRGHTGSAGACSSTWKFYWSYSKIGA